MHREKLSVGLGAASPGECLAWSFVQHLGNGGELRSALAAHADHADRVGTRLDGFVFSDDSGITAWKPNRVTKAFLRHRRNAGLRPFRLHDLRHFMATEMLHAGIPIVIVSRRRDHRRVSTTLDKYAHAVPSGDAQAAATLRQILTARPA